MTSIVSGQDEYGCEIHVRIEARPNTGAAWEHRNSVPAWAMLDRETARGQRAHVRSVCRDDWGQDSPVLLRIVDDAGTVVS